MEQLELLQGHDLGENPSFLKEQLITYIGNKRGLLPFIGDALRKVQSRLNRNKLSVLDLFSGTGIVARFLKQHSSHLIVNDLETYSRVTNECYLANASEIDHNALTEAWLWVLKQTQEKWVEGFICDLYAPKNEQAIQADDRVFYTRRNAAYLDSARMAIAEVPQPMQCLLLAPLLAKASVHANTSGVFKGFYKNSSGIGQFGGNGKDALTRIKGEITLPMPVFSRFDCDLQIHQRDANALVKELPEVDLAYFDPPYNQHPYGSNYFMLNLLVDYVRPMEVSRVSGIPTNWNRSRYNQRAEAAEALFEGVENCMAKFVLVSYNSEGFVDQELFLKRLSALGQVEICETSYNTFRGSRNLGNRSIHVTEFLYLLEKK
jgi:adenine-specific DNA-methyltransferase